MKICISSVWRNHFGTKDKCEPIWWDRALTDLGFKEGTFAGVTGKRESCRGQEIQTWLDGRTDIENYAIIDDDSDILEHQFDHFFHCDGWFGLTPNHLYRIKRHFDNKSNYRNTTKTL